MSSEPYRLARCPIVADPDVASLSDEERRIAEAFGDGRRRAEWVAGRAAARAALAKLMGPLPSRLAVASAGDGAPELVGLVGSVPKLSISHGKLEAVAVAGWVERLGVDLCDHVDAGRVRRVAERFIVEEERALAAALGDPAGWAALWALKEAAAKALRRGLLDGGLKASRLASIDPPRFEAPALEAAIERDPDHVVAVVWGAYSLVT